MSQATPCSAGAPLPGKIIASVVASSTSGTITSV